ncbi:MAG: DUF2341 domain-containing protein [Candidatus Kariarchaeaceae archaeon]
MANQENPTGVWSSNYQAVFHLNDDPTGIVYDSTTNGFNGASSGFMTSSDQVEGLLDDSIDFDGSDDLINIGDLDTDQWSGITVQAWILHDTTGDDRIICKSPSGVTSEHIISLAVVTSGSNDRLRVRFSTDGVGGTTASSRDSATTFTTGTWHHVAFTWDSTSERIYLYIDGSQDGNNYFKDGDSIYDSTLPVILANVNTGLDDRYYDGKLDEARISNVALSNNWINTEYNNQYDPYFFYSVGSLERPSSYETYRYRKDIVIDNTKVSGLTDLSQINVLLDIYDTNLREAGKIQNGGDNLIFTNINTGTNLYFEVEEWNQLFNDTHAYLRIWVQIDTLKATSDTSIAMFYGNQADYGYHRPDLIWSDYVGVWHLGESVADEGSAVNVHIDTTTNTNHGNQHGNDDSEGIIGDAQDFDGTDDYLEMGDINTLELVGDSYFTFTGWFYRDTTSTTDVILDKLDFPGGSSDQWTGFSLWIDGSDGLLYFRTADDDDDGFQIASTSNFNSLPTGWYFYAITFHTSPSGESDGSKMKIYINGIDEAASATLWGWTNPDWAGNDDYSPSNNDADFTIGAFSNNTDHFDGKIDEIRIIERLLSADWIKTEYNNQYDPNSFYSIGSEVENVNWWTDQDFGRRKDISIDHLQFTQVDESAMQYPFAPGYTETYNHYAQVGTNHDYLAVNEPVPDDDSTYIYTTRNDSSRYTSYKIKGLREIDGSITDITLYTRAERSGSVISSYIRNFVRIGSQNYQRSQRSLSTSWTTYSDTWTTNPATGLAWEWTDLDSLEIGVRGRMVYSTTRQLRITQVYAVVSYTSNGGLFNIPLLVELHDSDLKTDVQSDGSDIAFYDASGDLLEHDLVNFDQNSNTTHAYLRAWVKMNYLPTTQSSTISMYYGNNTIGTQEQVNETWEDYLAVYHMEEDPSGTTFDSTNNSLDLTSAGGMTSGDLVSGQVGSAIDFDGDGQLYTTQTTTIDSFTVSAWIRYDIGSGWRTIVNFDRSVSDWRDFAIVDNYLVFDLAGTRYNFISGLNPFTWYYTSFTYKAETAELNAYLDGVQVGTTQILSIPSTTYDFQIGAWGSSADFFDGMIDEVRISDQIHPAQWINIEYASQSDPASILSIGSEIDHAPPIVENFGIDDPGDGSPTVWANVTDSDSTVESVTVRFDGSDYSMSENGTGFWVYQPVGISYGENIDYQIINTSDTQGNYLKAGSSLKNNTFDHDTVFPSVIDWEYNTSLNEFRANVSDGWGNIDTVIVNVTYHENIGDTSSLWAVMKNTAYGYMNNTIVMIEGAINFVVTVNDSKGNTFTSTEHPGFVPNTPPTASNLNLSKNDSTVIQPVTSNDTLYFLYDYSDADSDNESNSMIVWQKWVTNHWETQSAYNDLRNISSSALTKGDIWQVDYKPKDGKDFGIWYTSNSITIQNSVPIVSQVDITPASPTTNSTLTAEYNWLDADLGDSDTASQIRWYRDNGNGSGFLLLSSYNDLLQVQQTDLSKGDVFYFSIIPGDGIGLGIEVNSSSITILNTPPTLIVKINNHSVPTTVLANQNLTATYDFYDVDDDSANLSSLEIRWWLFNLTLGKFESFINDTDTILNTSTSDNDLWRVDVWINDGINYSVRTSSATISIGVPPNNPPSAWYVNLTSSNPVAGGYLYANYTFVDPDVDDESLTTFQWFKNGIHQPEFDGIQTLTTATLIKGDNWTVQVKPQDSKNDFGEWNSSLQITILNTAPEVISAEVFPSSNIYTSNALLVDYQATDIDDDTITNISIVWLNGSTEISSLYNSTQVPSSYLKKGEVWKYIIKVFDGFEWSDNITSASITVLNSLMSFDSVSFVGGENTLDDINISFSYVDLDLDQLDQGQTKINWTIEYEGGGSTVVNGVWLLGHGNFSAGDSITVEITPHDGESLGQVWEAYRTRIIIGNAIPTILGQPNILGPNNSTDFYASGQLHVNYSAVDGDLGESSALYNIDYDLDGYIIGAEYLWYRNNTLLSELNTPNVPISYLNKGDSWKVSVRPRDRFGDYGSWKTSSSILIINTPPIIIDINPINTITRSDKNLEIGFTYSDYDGDAINLSKTLILWYLDSILVIGAENGTITNSEQSGKEFFVTILLYSDYYTRGDNITVEIQPYDGYEWALLSNTSSGVIIANAKPYAFNVKLQPNGTDLPAYKTDNLNVSWSFSDPDNDPEIISLAKIIWKNKGVPQPTYENQTSILSGNISKGDVWTVEIFVFDGNEWSAEPKISSPLIVQNTAPTIVSVSISSSSGNTSETFGNTDLIFSQFDDLNYTDDDNDYFFSFGTRIRWYRNGVHQPIYDGLTTLPSSALLKDDYWFIEVQITDDLVIYSDNQTSQNVTIVNKAPIVASVDLPNAEHYGSGFLVEDEDINISINLSDVDPGDGDSSYIIWMVDGTIQTDYTNLRAIPAEVTEPGQIWTANITASDGFDNASSVYSYIFNIESRPRIENFSVDELLTGSDGEYIFSFNANDLLNDISIVSYALDLNETGSAIKFGFPEQNATGHWRINFDLLQEADNSYFGNIIIVNITVTSSKFIVKRISFNYTLRDVVAPRIPIDGVYFVPDRDVNPQNLTFYAGVEEYGSGIADVTLHYYFNPVNVSGEASTMSQSYTSILMTFDSISGNRFIYTAIVPVPQEGNYEVFYQISTTDNTGNANPLAFDISNSDNIPRIIHTPEDISGLILMIAGIVIALIFVGAVVYVRFIRKPEIVGLDKELVMKGVSEITEEQIYESLDRYTLGLVVSFFDQRHGPVPIIVVPDMLKDNFSKLVELSDRSFSGTGFSDDFESENYSSYDFAIAPQLKISVLSFGFALDKPEARGGQENLTFNLLLQKDVFEMVDQFRDEFKEKVHDFHLLMVTDSSNKPVIRTSANAIRKYVTSIILSYINIYGTTELIEEED